MVNDFAERALCFLTEFNTGKITKDENQRQDLMQVVRHMRKLQVDAASSSERVTKKSIIATDYMKV